MIRMRSVSAPAVSGTSSAISHSSNAGPFRLIRNGPALLLWLMALLVPLTAGAETERILIIPPTRWDHAMSRDQPAQLPGYSDLANLAGGIGFGLSPAQVNAKLPTPAPGVEWIGLPFAPEYPDEVRYFWVRFDAVRELLSGTKACTGGNSYGGFLFRDPGLFR